MQINHGLVAGKVRENGNFEVFHFCGYENEPTEVDIESFKHELATDPEFGQVGNFSELKFARATPEMVAFYTDVASEVENES